MTYFKEDLKDESEQLYELVNGDADENIIQHSLILKEDMEKLVSMRNEEASVFYSLVYDSLSDLKIIYDFYNPNSPLEEDNEYQAIGDKPGLTDYYTDLMGSLRYFFKEIVQIKRIVL